MPDAAAARSRRASWLARGLAALVALSGAVLFVRTQDPMVLAFGVLGGLLALVVGLALAKGRPEAIPPPVRCGGCHALNLAGSRYCAQCGKAL